MDRPIDYIAFSDESYVNEQYRTIASFSFPSMHVNAINSRIFSLLKESDVSEFKWKKLKDAKYCFCASKMINAVFDFIYSCQARLDVIIWDTKDSRHSIPNRDDTANYERMYFHLHANLMKRRPKGSTWRLYPDEQVEIDWGKINDCLAAIGRRRHIESPLCGQFFADPHYQISELKQIKSHEEPCSQIADLFAGIAAFSKTNFTLFEQWLKTNDTALRLFPEEEVTRSNREEYRFRLLRDFNSVCKQKQIGVSLNSRRCLHTPKPENPLNFWHYMPQHGMDKAPLKKLGPIKT